MPKTGATHRTVEILGPVDATGWREDGHGPLEQMERRCENTVAGRIRDNACLGEMTADQAVQ